MNPELPQVRQTPEAMPQIPGGAEYFPDGSVRTPETAPSHEHQPAPVEQANQPIQAVPAIGTMPVAAPVSPPATDDGAVSSAVQGTPTIAGDDDLIEKEWVDKAKKIIALTKGSPYDQAKAISALQADYLKKRYNRVFKEGDSSS